MFDIAMVLGISPGGGACEVKGSVLYKSAYGIEGTQTCMRSRIKNLF